MAQSIGWVVPALMLGIAPVVTQAVQPSGVLTTAEVAEAISDGLNSAINIHISGSATGTCRVGARTIARLR
ncbi:MAG: hypothetical protein FJW21_11895 [Acidimicrobiia bacterium]|nr:hypothetical protein [Acidimicrobiia bacterium]